MHDTDITLNEAPVNPATGKEIAGERVQTNTYQNLEQGSELDKDPSVTIKNSAADCYVFVEVSNLKNNTAIYDVTIDNNWMKVDSKSTATTDVYVYTTNGTDPAIVSGGLTTANGIVFDGVSIKDDAVLFDEVVENGVVTGYTAKTLSPIVLKACAVQANNTTYAEALNEVAFGA